MERKRIFIGMPCYGEVAPEVLEDFGRFMFHLGRRLPQYDFFLGIRTKAEQFRARNQLVDAASQVNADYLLMLDDDMLVNPDVTSGITERYSFLETLIAHDKDIIGVLYYQKHGDCAPVAMVKQGEKGYRFLRDDEITHGLQQVDVAGGGCLLVKMKVFHHLSHPYFAPEFEFGTDVQLCRAAAEKGFTSWIDSSIEFGHLKAGRSIIYSRTRHQEQTESVPGEVKRAYIGQDVYDAVQADAAIWTGYPTLQDMADVSGNFLQMHATYKAGGDTDWEWYQRFPKERVARQVAFNTLSQHKRQMTLAILNSVNHHEAKDILDFGCGIGIPAFTFAQKGHRVTACDLQGTGTFEFLQWRAKQHGLEMTFHESRGDVPHLGDAQFDVIVAMDCLEHIVDWKLVLRELAAHLKPNGVLFANNAILDDPTHPEHYDMGGASFVEACRALDLLPMNDITYVKRVKVALPAPREDRLVHA